MRASYPCIYAVAREDWRCVQEVKKVADSLSLEFHTWTVTSGLDGTKKHTDPNEAIVSIIGKEGVFAFVNFHHFLDGPEMMQVIKDLVQVGKGAGQTVVFVSNIWEVPQELQDDMTRMDFTLPEHDLLSERIEYLVNEPSIKDKIPELSDTEKEGIVEAALGMTTWEAENAMSLSITEFGKLTAKPVAQEKARAVAKSGILEFYEPHVDMSDVGGLDNLKAWLAERSNAFSKEAREYGLPHLKGILLIGVPGCGKSLCAKAISSEWSLPLIRFDLGRLFQGLVGASEENVRRAIAVAESVAPVVLWIDEIEKGMAGAGGSGNTDSGVTARVFGTLISWMQDRQRPVFVVATANQIYALPPELMRAGRWDEIFSVDLPSVKEREEVLRIHIKKRGRDPENFSIENLAIATNQFSPAELEQVIIKGMFKGFSAGREVNDTDLLDSIRETVPLAVTRREDIDAMRQWSRTRAVPASSSTPPEISSEEEVFKGRKLRLKTTTIVEEINTGRNDEVQDEEV